MTTPAKSATLLRVNLRQISDHWPATAIAAGSSPGRSGLMAGRSSAKSVAMLIR